VSGSWTDATERSRILVADDDPTSRLLLKAVLEQAGFTVEEVGDGEQAVASFRRRPPDLAILDVLMPRRDGFEACAEMRRLPGGEALPILILTGLDDIASIRKAYDAGATDFASKPISPLLLEHRLRYMLRARRTYDALRESEARLAAAQRMAGLGHWERDLRTGAMEWSEEIYRLLDLRPGEMPPSFDAYLERIHPEDRDLLARAVEEAQEGTESYQVDLRVVRSDGATRHVHEQGRVLRRQDGAAVRLAGTTQDITLRKEAESQIRLLAYYDGLTSLPNRTLFVERLTVALSQARRNQDRLAVVFLDLDNFKLVNDTHGHLAGDRLLREVAERLRGLVRRTDDVGRGEIPPDQEIAARLGGDEFIVWLAGIRRGEDAARVAERILQSLSRPFDLGGEELYVTGSIGISLFPDDAEDVEGLLKHADSALYQAKAEGRNGYQFYSRTLQTAAKRRLGLESSLRRAIERREFQLYYQPQVDLATGSVTGAEALLRWQHPDLGLVPPLEFIPVAEETGLILPLGEWIVEEAVRQARGWMEHNSGSFTVAVNFSARQFRQANLAETLHHLLVAAGMPPDRFEVEITESLLLSDRDRCLETLERLQSLGMRICVDDFGTGYSSLNYLANLPVHTLKIDRSFVGGLADPRQAAVTSAIIALAAGLGLKVVAEGVETEQQRSLLRERGCRLAQGYLFSRPVPAEHFTALLDRPTIAPEPSPEEPGSTDSPLRRTGT
jgi:diguanylate cyclase (GGDEF)-like protein/PAS domain S-box-containing protein